MRSNPYIWKQSVYHREYVRRGLCSYLSHVFAFIWFCIWVGKGERKFSDIFTCLFFLSDSEKQFKHLVYSNEKLQSDLTSSVFAVLGRKYHIPISKNRYYDYLASILGGRNQRCRNKLQIQGFLFATSLWTGRQARNCLLSTKYSASNPFHYSLLLEQLRFRKHPSVPLLSGCCISVLILIQSCLGPLKNSYCCKGFYGLEKYLHRYLLQQRIKAHSSWSSSRLWKQKN